MREQFRVDLRGIVDILSHHLYSSPKVYLREVLQNGTDALTARGTLERGFSGSVHVTPSRGASPMVVRDDGVGLTDDEMRTVLSSIGGSSKRDDFTVARGEFLGQFGIGLLSCFLVADEIVLRSRSARTPDAPTIRWVGHADGTFSIGEADESLDHPGTEVVITPRHGDQTWCNEETVEQLTRDFAEHLTTPVYVDDRLVSRVPPPWELSIDEQLAWCQERLGFEPMGIVPLESSLLDVKGLAYVLPYSAQPGHRTGDRLYSRGMLVADNGSQVLPGWAFFCRAVLDCGQLPLTASREGLQETPSLDIVRGALGNRLLGELIMVHGAHPDVYEEIVKLHADGLKALAVSDRDMRDLLRSTMPFGSTRGNQTLDTLANENNRVSFVTSYDVYLALRDVAMHAGELVVDASGPYDAELLRTLDPGLMRFREVHSADIADLIQPSPAHDEEGMGRLCEAAVAVLAPDKVQVHGARFAPEARSVLWWPTDDDRDAGRSVLIFNEANPTVRRLMELAGHRSIDDAVRALHVVGMLLGRADVSIDRAGVLADAIGALVTVDEGATQAAPA